ncbi:MAG: cation:proton antiporter [Candidatus Micrarchaeota archaeon]|nr:cation:proton antiporter [Candidatus Micrarchaeota archaeon]
MAGQEAAIGALGILILAGVFSRAFLKMTGVSDVFILMLLGVAAGALLPGSAVEGMQGFMLPLGAVALLMIMLEEGMLIPFENMRRHVHKAFLFGAVSFLLSAVLGFSVSYFIAGIPLPISLLIGAMFASVAPELLSGILSSIGTSESVKGIGGIEAVFSEALSVILSLAIISAIMVQAAFPLSDLPFQLAFVFLFSLALGGIFAAAWKAAFSKVEHENMHLLVIGLAAVLYALAGAAGANGVISVFAFAFLLGNTSHASIAEVRRFQSEIGFFLRTIFFVYLGALLFHSPKPAEVALLALAISLLLALARLLSGKVARALDSSAKEDRLLEAFSGRGMACAVIAVIAAGEISSAGGALPIDLPLLALFVIFFTNAISAVFMLGKRGKRIGAPRSGGKGGIGEVLKGGLYGT